MDGGTLNCEMCGIQLKISERLCSNCIDELLEKAKKEKMVELVQCLSDIANKKSHKKDNLRKPSIIKSPVPIKTTNRWSSGLGVITLVFLLFWIFFK